MRIYPNTVETCVPYIYTDLYLADAFETLWYNLGNICSNYGISKLAIFCFENALRHKRQSIISLYRIGREFVFMRDFEKVFEVAKNLKELKNSAFHVNVLMGHVYLSKNNLSKSHFHFLKAMTYTKRDILLLFGVAKWNELACRYTVAFEYFSLLLKEYQGHVLSFEIRFRIVSLCKFDGAIQYAMRLLKTLEREGRSSPQKEAIVVQIASCYEILNEDETVLRMCRGVLSRSPNYVLAQRLLGFVLLKKERYQEMTSLLKKSSDPYVSYLLGRAFTALNMVNDAYECFSTALKVGKHDPTFWNAFGVMYYSTGQIEDAGYCFENATICDKSAIEPLFNMILVRDRQRRDISEISWNVDALLKKNSSDRTLLEMRTLVDEHKKKQTEGNEDDFAGGKERSCLFKDIKCKEMNVNLSFTPYFATHLFFDGKIFNHRRNGSFEELCPLG
eukprot:jgi/Antlo1/764/594